MSEINPYQTPATVDGSDNASTLGGTQHDLSGVRKGLRLIHFGVIAMLATFIIGVLGPIIGSIFSMGVSAMLPQGIAVIGGFGGLIAIFAGGVYCTSIPVESNAKTLAGASLVLQSVAIATALATAILVITGLPIFNTRIVIALANLISITSWTVSLVMFLIVLKRLNLFIGDRALAQSAKTVMVMLILSVCLYLFGTVGVGIVASRVNRFGMTGFVLGLFMLTLLTFGLITFVKFANLVNYTSKAVSRLPAT